MQSRQPTEDEAAAIVAAFDDAPDDSYTVSAAATLVELRAAGAARREAEGRIEAAAIAAHRAGLSWGYWRPAWYDPPGREAAVRTAG